MHADARMARGGVTLKLAVQRPPLYAWMVLGGVQHTVREDDDWTECSFCMLMVIWVWQVRRLHVCVIKQTSPPRTWNSTKNLNIDVSCRPSTLLRQPSLKKKVAVFRFPVCATFWIRDGSSRIRGCTGSFAFSVVSQGVDLLCWSFAGF